MTRPIPIPPEVVEAAEDAYYEAWDSDEPALLAALRAALKAWPMRQVRAWDDVQGVGVFIILPLPQETRDE